MGDDDLVVLGGKMALILIPLGMVDLLVHHIHAFMIHVTILIFLKCVIFARSSCLISNKANLDFHFPCAISVVIFYFSWKMKSDVWGSISDQGTITHITGGDFV